MIWVSWRQHRSQAITCLGLLCALAVFAIVVGSSMRTAFAHDGLAGCLAHGAGTGTCQNAFNIFMTSFSSIVNTSFWALLLLLPGLIGVVVGAPLIARELEFGTWRLAWSQSVPRTRWLVTTLALVTGGLVLLGAAMTAVITWYREPMDRLTGHFINNVYDFEGLVLTAYILLAFGLAVLAGLLIRRSIPAMVTALVVWLGIKLGVEYLLRPHFQTPATLLQACQNGCSINLGINSVPPQSGHIGDWVLGIAQRGNNQLVISYQPASRFWHFQFIEAGLLVAITAMALAATIWMLHRRAA
jgi:ABC-type transport system involved in multi-copper enzyme maturation permease subunit